MADKRIFFSDFHMGVNQDWTWLKRAKVIECGDLISALYGGGGISDIFLLGDIFDDNVCPVDITPPTFQEIAADPINKELVDALKAINDSSIKLHLVKGNHDVGITQDKIRRIFNRIIFQNESFLDGNLIASHGNSDHMWTAEDTRPNNAFAPLPIGYFFSRLWVNCEIRENYKTKKNIIKMLGGFMTGHETEIVKYGVTQLTAKAGLQLTEPVKMNSDYPQCSGITLNDVSNNYRDLDQYWFQKYGLFAGIDFMGIYIHFIYNLFYTKGYKVVIWGHTHQDKILNTGINNSCIYANCGKATEGKIHFVENEKVENGKQVVRLKYWDRKAKKIRSVDEFVTSL